MQQNRSTKKQEKLRKHLKSLVLILKRLAYYRERKTFTCFLFEKGKTVLLLGDREVLSDPNVVRNNKTKRRWASVFGNIGKSFCWPHFSLIFLHWEWGVYLPFRPGCGYEIQGLHQWPRNGSTFHERGYWARKCEWSKSMLCIYYVVLCS